MQFAVYKKTLKRAWVAEKADLMSLLGNIKTKLGTYGLKDYVPPPNLSLPNLDRVWTHLMQAENRRSMQINQKIREYCYLGSGTWNMGLQTKQNQGMASEAVFTGSKRVCFMLKYCNDGDKRVGRRSGGWSQSRKLLLET